MKSKFESMEIDEDLMNQIKGMIETFCVVGCASEIELDAQDFYYTMTILRAKYRELLIQIGYVNPDESYSGMTFHDDIKPEVKQYNV